MVESKLLSTTKLFAENVALRFTILCNLVVLQNTVRSVGEKLELSIFPLASHASEGTGGWGSPCASWRGGLVENLGFSAFDVRN